jgi:hypothetical protein
VTGDPAARVLEVIRSLEDGGEGLQHRGQALLPQGGYFIGGSGGLALRGLRHASDLDIGVPTAVWFALAASPGWELVTPDPQDPRRRCDPPIVRTYVERRCGEAVKIDAWFAWRWRGFHETEWNDFNMVFRDGIEYVRGLPCLKLVHLLRMKVDAVQNGYDDETVRPKDLNDIGLIQGYMSGGGK